ncbi:PIR Superfamily Protein [Plasmodium ovale wallikeri]|uniref:PIR Superfamily Protein n=1 Tax=Plasmodium ovale wallikeri TaxID=864142 RepID=A0A1A9ARF3_PLAOA|nr:PIR Superfamily Protein [Plasmodium ovale wallikeri]SBT58818.1 PIR Superfamily Protein [Plasmodium ovale wallikeri]
MLDYRYENVKNFQTYKNVLDQSSHNYNIDASNDSIINKRKKNTNASTFGGFPFIDLCIKINKYLKHYSSINGYNSEHCEYLNYWLNEKKRNKNNKDSSLYRDVLDYFNHLNIFDADIPHINEYKSKLYLLQDDIFDKVDTIYKLYDHYFSFITKKEHGKTNNEVCNHADSFAKIYNGVISDCNYKIENGFCNELAELKKKYQHKVSRMVCPLRQDLLTSFQAYAKESYTYEKYFPREDDDPYTARDIAILVGKILGVCVIPFLLYKYTRLGSCLRPRKRKKKKYFANVKDKTYAHYSRDYGNQDAMPYNEQYNMQYYSSENYE